MSGSGVRRIFYLWIAGWMVLTLLPAGVHVREGWGRHVSRMPRPDSFPCPRSGRGLPGSVRVCHRKGLRAQDQDRDGVSDGMDDCPDTPAGAQVDERGCPKDSDQDGIYDGIDRCKGTPIGAWVNRTGCPSDRDRDGVLDGLDLCPDTPTQALVNADGCAFDSDGDGVLDGIDRCPDTPLGALADKKGCSFDTDRDGVPDGLDTCPATPPQAKADPMGCSPAQAAGGAFERIRFRPGSTELEADAYRVLEEVARMLKANPSMVIEIGGHTDSTGQARLNRSISLQRAETVKSHLLSRGVPARQMVTKGYGELEPIASNRTRAGRAANRRIEFRILSR